jgi:hypothetical protein
VAGASGGSVEAEWESGRREDGGKNGSKVTGNGLAQKGIFAQRDKRLRESTDALAGLFGEVSAWLARSDGTSVIRRHGQ